MDVVITMPTSSVMVDDVSPDPLDALHASPSCSLPYLPPKHYNLSLVPCHDMLEGNEIDYMDSLGTFRGCDPSLDPYGLYLGSMPAKIMLTIEFNFFSDFSRHLINLGEPLLLFRHCCLSALTYIHLSCTLRCLTSSCEL